MRIADRKIEAVLFDKDGTLMDFQMSWGPWAKAVIDRLCGEDTDKRAQLSEALGFDWTAVQFRPDSAVIAGTPEDVLSLLRPHFPQATDTELLTWLEPDPADFYPAPVLGLTAVCETLSAAGLALAVVTNDFEESAVEHIDIMGVSNVFSAIIGYDSGYGGKPAPDPCFGAAAQLGVAPERCVMVGDSLHDLEAGAAAGMICVGVLTGVANAATLAPYADVVLDSIADLPRWLGAIG